MDPASARNLQPRLALNWTELPVALPPEIRVCVALQIPGEVMVCGVSMPLKKILPQISVSCASWVDNGGDLPITMHEEMG